MNCAGNLSGAARKRRVQKANGYALLLVMFFLALLTVSVGVATPNILTEGRREKETEMIWRGKQYVRGVRLYYRKTHRFPTQLEDLYTAKTGIRFMRQAYKDPMNNVDGSWRLICVGPNGQLIGSLRERKNAFFFGAPAPTGFAGALGSAPASSPFGNSLNSSSSSSSSFGNSSLSNSASSSSSQNSPSTTGNPATQTPNPSTDPNAPAQDSSNSTSTTQTQSAAQDSNPTLGQTIIIGVGSKINKRSIALLDGEKNYLQFEFIWNGSDPNSGSTAPQ